MNDALEKNLASWCGVYSNKRLKKNLAGWWMTTYIIRQWYAGFWFIAVNLDSFECHIEDSITYAIAVLVAVDDHCFDRCWKFWVNQTQVLLNVPVLMSRKYIRHYIFWTQIMKRTVRLKLNDIDSFDVLQ